MGIGSEKEALLVFCQTFQAERQFSQLPYSQRLNKVRLHSPSLLPRSVRYIHTGISAASPVDFPASSKADYHTEQRIAVLWVKAWVVSVHGHHSLTHTLCQ